MMKYVLLALLLMSSAMFAQSFTNGQSAACSTYYYPTSHSVYCVAAPMYDAANGNAMGALSMYALVDHWGKLLPGSFVNVGQGNQEFAGTLVGSVFSGTFAGGVISSEVLGTKRVCARYGCRTVTIIAGGSGEIR